MTVVQHHYQFFSHIAYSIQLLKCFTIHPHIQDQSEFPTKSEFLYRTALRKVSRISPFRHKFDISAVKRFEREIRVMRRCSVQPEDVFVCCVVSLDKQEQNSLQILLRIYLFVASKSWQREKSFEIPRDEAARYTISFFSNLTVGLNLTSTGTSLLLSVR